jgi:gamma-glutamyltranspeptidase/glutathione hydrolase
MYIDTVGNIMKGKRTIGGDAVGVPGTIAGIFEAHNRVGSLPI